MTPSDQSDVMIEATLADGRVVKLRKGVDSPKSILKASTKDEQIIATVAPLELKGGTKDKLWDVTRPLEESCRLHAFPLSTLNSFNEESLLVWDTLWHSSAHLLGWAMETQYGDDLFLADGPTLESANSGGVGGGYFYDGLLSKLGPNIVERRVKAVQGFSASNLPTDIEKLAQESEKDIHLLTQSLQDIYHTSQTDLTTLTTLMNKLSNTPGGKPVEFQRIQISRSLAILLFFPNPLKLALLARIPPTEPITVYKCGNFIDLCRGPHVPHVGLLRASKLLRTGAAQFTLPSPTSAHTPSSSQPSILSRVVGITFPKSSQLVQWEHIQSKAAARDHRVIGKQQSLFIMHPLSPGSPFFLPHGMRVVNRMLEFLRAEYRRCGYEEVVTPLLFNKKLWETSGHWQNYREDMFVVAGGGGAASEDVQTVKGCTHDHGHEQHAQEQEEVEETHGLKPMNCPGHCLIFNHKKWSYRELPVRFAEFSPLHRNEASGALTGLTRVRKFHQDDAHIFCTPDQVQSEISAFLGFVDRTYKALGFPEYSLALSTRPQEKYMGTDEQWAHAESALRQALEATGKRYTIKEGDGAFYGPKIDVMVSDAIGRSHQTATVQLDFQLPIRFGLTYATDDPAQPVGVPVMIHRAALGSVERMMAVLIEHHEGKWPFWMSPRQAIVVPATNSERVIAYARSLADGLSRAGVGWDVGDFQRRILEGEDGVVEGVGSEVEVGQKFYYVDARLHDVDASLGKRIRDAWVMKYNFVLVVGEKELNEGTVSVRHRDGGSEGKNLTATMTVAELLSLWRERERAFE